MKSVYILAIVLVVALVIVSDPSSYWKRRGRGLALGLATKAPREGYAAFWDDQQVRAHVKRHAARLTEIDAYPSEKEGGWGLLVFKDRAGTPFEVMRVRPGVATNKARREAETGGAKWTKRATPFTPTCYTV